VKAAKADSFAGWQEFAGMAVGLQAEVRVAGKEAADGASGY